MKILQQTPTEFVIQQGRNLRQESLTILLLFLCCSLPSLWIVFFLVDQIQSILFLPTSATLNCQRNQLKEIDCILIESKLIGDKNTKTITDKNNKLLGSKVIPANTRLANEERNSQVLLQMSSGEITLPQSSSSKMAYETVRDIEQFLQIPNSAPLTIQQNFTWLDFARDFGLWMGSACLIGGFLFLHGLYSLLAFGVSIFKNPLLETYRFDRELGVLTVEYKSWFNPQKIQLPLQLILDVDVEGEEGESKLLFMLASRKNFSTFYPIEFRDKVGTSDEIEAQETAQQIRHFLNLEADSLPDSTQDMIDRETS